MLNALLGSQGGLQVARGELKKNFNGPRFMDDGVQLPKGYGHFKEAVYFSLTSAQKDERLS